MTSVAVTERSTRPAAVARSVVDASLRLELRRDAESGHTVLAASHQEPPLKVVRAFPLEDGAALVHLHNVSGGLLGGDRLKLSVDVGAEARVQITTTGATRIYRPRAEASPATQSNEIVVGANALLEYLPDAVIPFWGARFRQRTTIQLATGAGLFWWEILAPGREARGEIFEYPSVELKTDLLANGHWTAAERVRLQPHARDLTGLARLGPYRTWGSFYICRVGADASTWSAMEQGLREIASGLSQRQDVLWGVSALVAHGLVVRCAAKRGRDVLPGLQVLWSEAKMRVYGRAAVPPRKVN
jgi:urease accessory protein